MDDCAWCGRSLEGGRVVRPLMDTRFAQRKCQIIECPYCKERNYRPRPNVESEHSGLREQMV